MPARLLGERVRALPSWVWTLAFGVLASAAYWFWIDGIAPWLWERWRVLEGAGLDRVRFFAIVVGYRREIWLWLMGERTWVQCCSGLIGRIDRRLSAG